MNSIKITVAIALMVINTGLLAFDLETFRSLDPDELRAAEASMDEYIEAGTARLLRAPRGAAERYVAQRQQRLARQFNRRAAAATSSQGARVQPIFWPAARASRASLGADGEIVIRCQPARSMLDRSPSDSRARRLPARPVR